MMRIRFSVASAGLLLATVYGPDVVAQEAGSAVSIDVESIRMLLLSGFENNRLMDVDFVRAIPDSALRWAPNEVVRDFAEQIEHTALGNVLFVAMGVTDGERPSFGDPDHYLNDKEALVEAVNAAYDWVMESLRRLPVEELVMETELFGQEMAKWRVYLQALEHAYWTRGQLVPYCRAHGITPPSCLLKIPWPV